MSKSFEELEMEMEQLRAELRAEIAEARKEIAEARAIMTTLQSLASGEAAAQCVAVKSDVCAVCSDEQPDEFVGEAGVPIDDDQPDAAEVDRVWLMGAPATLSGMYDDALVLKEDAPWCGIDANGDVCAFSKRPELMNLLGWGPDEDEDLESSELGSIGGPVDAELWHWDAGAWTRVFPGVKAEKLKG